MLLIGGVWGDEPMRVLRALALLLPACRQLLQGPGQGLLQRCGAKELSGPFVLFWGPWFGRCTCWACSPCTAGLPASRCGCLLFVVPGFPCSVPADPMYPCVFLCHSVCPCGRYPPHTQGLRSHPNCGAPWSAVRGSGTLGCTGTCFIEPLQLHVHAMQSHMMPWQHRL